MTVFIVSSIPIGQPNDHTAGLTLTAFAAAGRRRGRARRTTWTRAGSEDRDVVDTVFGDTVAGDTDGVRDGAHSDDDAYRVQTATLTVTKTSTVISDPFNGTTVPKRIPGAVIEYCVTVENTRRRGRPRVVLTDVLTGPARDL